MSERPHRSMVPIAGIFVLALIARVGFVLATPDRDGSYSVFYKGDSDLWLAQASAWLGGPESDFGLPLRPPATGLLVAALMHLPGADTAQLRLVFAVLGALVAPMGAWAAWRTFGARVATILGGLLAASTALIVLSASIDSETPYLLLVLGSLVLLPSLREGHGWFWFGFLSGLAWLFRAEHPLSVLAIVLALQPWRLGRARALSSMTLLAAGLALPIVPWQVHVFRVVDQANRVPNPNTEVQLTRVEAGLPRLAWDPAAEARVQELPAFVRQRVRVFVAAAVVQRGRDRVQPADLSLVRDAFGYWPEPLPRLTPVALYGPMNFWLANNPEATGGFSRRGLDREPPFVGGRENYPWGVFGQVPSGSLSLEYPPQLQVFLHGYQMGVEWLWAHPAQAFNLLVIKARQQLAVLRHGVTSVGVPAGLNGVAWPVDICVPTGWSSYLTQAVWLLLGAAGLLTFRSRDLLPWLSYGVSKFVVGLAFFGYARGSALALPCVLLLAAIAIDRGFTKRFKSWTLLLPLVFLSVELGRWAFTPHVRVNGLELGLEDPVSGLHVTREIEVQWTP